MTNTGFARFPYTNDQNLIDAPNAYENFDLNATRSCRSIALVAAKRELFIVEAVPDGCLGYSGVTRVAHCRP